MKAAAGGGMGMVHLLASLTSIATCLLVVVCLGAAYKQYLGSLLGVHGAPSQRSIQRHGIGHSGSGTGWTGGTRSHDACLAAVSNGIWRRVSNLTRSSPLPPEVAAWHVEDAFIFANESFSYEWSWEASAVSECGMRRRTPADMALAFSNKRLVFLGDSHVLYFHNWLAIALGGSELSKGVPLMDLVQTLKGSNIRLEMYHQRWLDAIDAQLRSWAVSDWPDLLVLDSAEWPLFVEKNMTQHELRMRALLEFLQEQAPPHTLVVWLSPPPRDEKKWNKPALPADWIHMYDRVAQDVGFYRPQGPALHLDLFQLALDCLAWCTISDGIHVVPTVNEVLVQQLTNAFLVWRGGGPIAEPQQPGPAR